MERSEVEIPALDLGSLSHSLPNITGLETLDTTLDNTSLSGYGVQYGTDIFKGIDIKRSDTPNTYLPEFSNNPDITLKCEQCGYFVKITNLREHRKYHSSIQILKYKTTTLPETSDELLKRRNQLVKKLKQSATADSPPNPQHIQNINEAYEFLKAHIEDTFEELRQIGKAVDTGVNGVALNCSPPCVHAVGIASSANRRWKGSMEDTRIYQDFFGEDSDKCYLGLFDGHNGHFAAESASSDFHKILLNEMRKFDPRTISTEAVTGSEAVTESKELTGNEAVTGSKIISEGLNVKDNKSVMFHEESVNLVQQIMNMCEEKYDNYMNSQNESQIKPTKQKSSKFKDVFSERISEAYKKSYKLFDILLSYGKDERSKVRWSGCSALNVVIQNTLSTDNATDQMTFRDSDSREPLKQLGLLHVANAGNVQGILVRGNRSYNITKEHTPYNKRERERIIKAGASVNLSAVDCRVNGVLATTRGLGNHGDVKLKKAVLVDPYTTCVPIDQHAQFLVMATNGVWEVFSHEEVASLLLKLLPCNRIPAPSRMSDCVEALMFESAENKPHGSSRSDCASHIKNGNSNTSSNRIDGDTTEKSHVEVMTLPVDLQTEVGSHHGDDFDTSLNDNELISMPVHCTIPDHKPESQSDFRRELAKSMAEYLVQAALLAGSRDNISVIITLFTGSGV